MGAAMGRRARRYLAGVMAVEYTLVLMIFIGFMTSVGEVYRVSFYSQALARATHLGTTAAGQEAWRCEQAFSAGFTADPVSLWLFDDNDNGQIEFAAIGSQGSSEVQVTISADDGRLANGVELQTTMGGDDDLGYCGLVGSWIVAEAVVSVRTSFGARRIPVSARSWALNQGA